MPVAKSVEDALSKPVIFNISAAWDQEASVWCGHCDDIPAVADAPTLDGLLSKITAISLDLLPDNHPGVEPSSVYLQLNALREAEPAAA
jgi:thiol-disulfide isomerase/thioredoxin